MFRPKGTQAPLTDREIGEFLTSKRPSEKSHKKAETALLMRNPIRWRRLQRDARWARKMLTKMGYNPEEIRWLV